jgi:hypothetical protein
MSGTLVGTVRNAAGTFIANATVTVPGVVVTITSGFYRGIIGSGGFYEITASAPGFQTVKQVRDLCNGAMNSVLFVLPPA